MIGGHPHYFRDRAPYIDPEWGSNLHNTLAAVWSRLPDIAPVPAFTNTAEAAAAEELRIKTAGRSGSSE